MFGPGAVGRGEDKGVGLGPREDVTVPLLTDDIDGSHGTTLQSWKMLLQETPHQNFPPPFIHTQTWLMPARGEQLKTRSPSQRGAHRLCFGRPHPNIAATRQH